MNGFELYQKIREIDSNVKICFLTASELFYEEYRRLESYPGLNKAFFIQKPCKSEERVGHLEEALHSH